MAATLHIQAVRAVIDVVDDAIATARFGAKTFRSLLGHWYGREIILAMYAIGIRSLPVVIAVAAFIGMTTCIQGAMAFNDLGSQSLVGFFCSLSLLRELGPIVAASMVGAKAGSQMAAQLGTMRVKQQIDALEVMAVDPLRFHVAPRLIAAILMVPLMVVVADAAAMSAAYLVAVHQLHLDGGQFIAQAFLFTGPADVYKGMLKGALFGATISIVCSYHGFAASGGPEGVGRATNRAVVRAAVICVFFNLALSEILYGGVSMH